MRFLGLLLLLFANTTLAYFPEDEVLVKITVASSRYRRGVYDKLKTIEVGDWTLELNPESNLVVAPQAEWIQTNEHVRLEDMPKCDYHTGTVRGFGPAHSRVAITVCGHFFMGFIGLKGQGSKGFFLEPIGSDGMHRLYRSKRSDIYLEKSVDRWLFNLTGDVIDIGREQDEIDSSTLDSERPQTNSDDIEMSSEHNLNHWHREQMDDEEIGYFFDTAWTANTPITHHHIVANANSTPKWLEIAIAVDYTLINFHGKTQVGPYVMALMNIVNAIYQDASLESNLKLVVTRLLLYEHKKQSVVRPGDSRRSLENVNSWNNRLHIGLAPGERHHDVAVWITRADIGGPSGYAPVSGACDPKRSCALNRDEGLTSAFIIAHEMAHILGLSHDGDKKNGNNCADSGPKGSVMAPLVTATFYQFFWSECSRKEMEKSIEKWSCLTNPPAGSGEIVLNSSLQNVFSMDEQCRMEFGEGYGLCRAFDIIEPCSHLWCGHEKSPLVCKTKKGSPLEGTECGFHKWCWNGYCQELSKRNPGRIPVLLNPQDGGWSTWTPWGTCSKSCGTGVQFRTRKCNNPMPMYGGNECDGVAEKWQTCNKKACEEPVADMRAQQCKRLAKLLNFEGSRIGNMTWLPYESEELRKKCKLTCISENSKEIFETDENVIDGTPCSYENSDNICIQGLCQTVGCDGKLFSTVKTDLCGVCGGNNSQCSRLTFKVHKKLKKEVSRVSVIPRQATAIRIEANITTQLQDPSLAFVLKKRNKKKYAITVPDVNGEIMEGTKFYYEKSGKRHEIRAKGPVLSEMVVLVYAPISEIEKGLSVTLSLEYVINNATSNSSTRFRWIPGGWGPCSVSCGGGKKLTMHSCWDNLNKKLVRRKHCSLVDKPASRAEKCNDFDCSFQWLPGQWEPCTATCGLQGVQHRELYCIPQSVVLEKSTNRTLVQEPWTLMVNPQKCSEISKPISERPCNREPCISYWSISWSQCSESCGRGLSYHSFYCPPPEGEQFYTCGESPALPEKRVCYGANKWTSPSCALQKRKPCMEDKSQFCATDLLMKYCDFGAFQRVCCKSCFSYHLDNVSI